MSSISVLIPVSTDVNLPHFERAFSSITNQTIEPSEIIIATNQNLPPELKQKIDQLCEGFHTTKHIHDRKAQGLGETLQVGLEGCSHDFVARMDADDIAEVDRFEKQHKVLSENDTQIVGSQLAEFSESPDTIDRIRNVPLTNRGIKSWMSWRCPINHPTAMFCKQPVTEIGYRRFPMMEDWDLWARCLASGLRFQNIDEALVRARISNLAGRRGGLAYAKAEIQMAIQLSKLGIATKRDTFKHIVLRIPPRILPEKIRNQIYRSWAR